jgi:hypothetical protein
MDAGQPTRVDPATTSKKNDAFGSQMAIAEISA